MNLLEVPMWHLRALLFGIVFSCGCKATIRPPPPVAPSTGPVAIGWVGEPPRASMRFEEPLLAIGYRSDSAHPRVELRMLSVATLVQSLEARLSVPTQIRRYRVSPGALVHFRFVNMNAPPGSISQLCEEDFSVLSAAYGGERVDIWGSRAEGVCDFIILTPP